MKPPVIEGHYWAQRPNPPHKPVWEVIQLTTLIGPEPEWWCIGREYPLDPRDVEGYTDFVRMIPPGGERP